MKKCKYIIEFYDKSKCKASHIVNELWPDMTDNVEYNDFMFKALLKYNTSPRSFKNRLIKKVDGDIRNRWSVCDKNDDVVEISAIYKKNNTMNKVITSVFEHVVGKEYDGFKVVDFYVVDENNKPVDGSEKPNLYLTQ